MRVLSDIPAPERTAGMENQGCWYNAERACQRNAQFLLYPFQNRHFRKSRQAAEYLSFHVQLLYFSLVDSEKRDASTCGTPTIRWPLARHGPNRGLQSPQEQRLRAAAITNISELPPRAVCHNCLRCRL